MNSQLSADYKGSSYTASVITANPDLLNGTGNLIILDSIHVVVQTDFGTSWSYCLINRVIGRHDCLITAF